jgi:hypothetical protein
MQFVLWLPLIFQEAVAQDGGLDRPMPAPAAQSEPAPVPAETAPVKIKKEKKKNAARAVPQDQPQSQEELPVERLKVGKRHRFEEPEWHTKVGAEMEYNDNVIRLDKRDIEAFKDGTKPDKFRITSVSDMIYTASVEEDVSFRLFDQPTTGGVGFAAHFFEANTFMDYEDIAAFLKTKTWEFKFVAEPKVYRREHRNLDTGLYESAFYSDYDAEFAVKLHPLDFLQIRPKMDIEYRDYDAPFEYYDTIYWGLSPRATIELAPWLFFWLEYRLVWANSFATDLQPDDSYFESGFEPGITVKPEKGLEFSARYYWGRRDYTTANDAFIDPNHAGRVDDRQHFKLRAEWKPSPNLAFHAEYAYTTVLTNKPFRPDVIDDEWSWTRKVFTLGVTYQF